VTGESQAFERGDPVEVEVGRIDAELSALWRRTAQATGGAITRACLWNLVVALSAEEDRFRAAKQLIDDLSQLVPARVIVTRRGAGEGDRVRAWVEANWRRDEGGRALLGSDEVTLEATGAGESFLPALVRSLILPDAPTAMLWLRPLPEGTSERSLLDEVDRLVLDSRRLEKESGLVALDRLAAAHPDLELADLSWIGLSPLRGLCASLFDRDPTPLERVDRVRVASRVSGTQARALLTLGWIGARLGLCEVRREDGDEAVRSFSALRRSGGRALLELEARAGAANHGVVELVIESGSARWSLSREQGCIDVRGPGVPPRVQPARSHRDAELVASALGPCGRDPLYREALAMAAQMVIAP
jgi:glucose-6-phosphate dehydrogenase assembly protein OpcA